MAGFLYLQFFSINVITYLVCQIQKAKDVDGREGSVGLSETNKGIQWRRMSAFLISPQQMMFCWTLLFKDAPKSFYLLDRLTAAWYKLMRRKLYSTI
ncbi:hypothetical protein CEXT_221881 [Caerostris extrusa]|uniref:Uncharacterized protein n=1 Tax=Caerostris extrusa TaxID=172846 RepID=A0AAV4XF81_CAEEX|nr:hypothetical protein CEXT_221881 [Caerostris extrusa]